MLYEINARIWIAEAARSSSSMGLDAIPSNSLDRLADVGIKWLWLMGVWQTGEAGRRISRTNPALLHGYSQDLPDFTQNDICGSPFAIAAYDIPREFGGKEALRRLRSRLADRGMRLMLDFVPNHTALDHPWVQEHPEYYIQGSEQDLSDRPQNYSRLETKLGPKIFAYGRDPYFDGWPDTLQLNFSNSELRDALTRQLIAISGLCDGLRCDMAMLLLPDVFRGTWTIDTPEFWREAILAVRRTRPDFVFMAEVYWGREWDVQQLGFDYTYDKRLYDRLRQGDARGVHEHLVAGLDFQNKLVRFVENHDEARAAAVFRYGQHRAAAVAAFFTPGLRFFHDGQWEGRKRHSSVHLCRRAAESTDEGVRGFYERLLGCLQRTEFHTNSWRRLEPGPAGEDNNSWRAVVAFAWGEHSIVVVNYSANWAQCRLPLPVDLPGTPVVRLHDRLGDAVYDRSRAELASPGLYLDMPAWGYHVFELLETR